MDLVLVEYPRDLSYMMTLLGHYLSKSHLFFYRIPPLAIYINLRGTYLTRSTIPSLSRKDKTGTILTQKGGEQIESNGYQVLKFYF